MITKSDIEQIVLAENIDKMTEIKSKELDADAKLADIKLAMASYGELVVNEVATAVNGGKPKIGDAATLAFICQAVAAFVG